MRIDWYIQVLVAFFYFIGICHLPSVCVCMYLSVVVLQVLFVEWLPESLLNNEIINKNDWIANIVLFAFPIVGFWYMYSLGYIQSGYEHKSIDANQSTIWTNTIINVFSLQIIE